MNVVKCSNGHFFDGDAYPQCPHCGASAGNGNQSAAVAEKSTSKKVFSWFDKKKTADHSNEAPAANSIPLHVSNTPSPSQPGAAWVSASHDSVSSRSDMSYDCGETVSLLDNGNSNSIPSSQPEKTPENGASAPSPASVSVDEGSSLKAAVKKASANEEGKTMSYFSAATAGDSGASAPAVNERPADPVVGWLVCLKGKHFGESFVICAGKNSIGRSENNRIVLNKENSVSREKHALIVYEPKKRRFYIQPGDSSGLTYLNDDYITESKQLSPRDMIELGDGKFVFVPLCDESFSWEDYISKE